MEQSSSSYDDVFNASLLRVPAACLMLTPHHSPWFITVRIRAFRNSARLRRAHIFDQFLWAQPRNPHRSSSSMAVQVKPWSNHPQSQDAVESGHGSNTLCLKAD
eukprot:scaffold7806_cov35-Cyclotella_meneghiniana.AAC.3